MYKTKVLPPYQDNGHTTFNKRATSGVYLIFKKNILRYVGFSSTNLYRTLYRHFQKWEGTYFGQRRVIYKNLKDIKVLCIYTDNAAQAENLEKALIIKKKPIDNPHKYKKYTTEPKEDKAYTTYTSAPTSDIIYNPNLKDEDIPF